MIGSTGTGKSQLAVSLARSIIENASQPPASRAHHWRGAEVISADSMQVYKGLDVITNKVTAEEMQGVKHHLIDFLPPGAAYTVGDFRSDAATIVSGLTMRMLPDRCHRY